MAQAVSNDLSHEEMRKLTADARKARLSKQADACRFIEKTAFQLKQLADENRLDFLVYLTEMLRAAAIDEQQKFTRRGGEPQLTVV